MSEPTAQRVIEQTATFADWRTQLHLASKEDRQRDIVAIATLQIPESVVLRHKTVVQEAPKVRDSAHTIVFGSARQTLYRDELISYYAMSAHPNASLLPSFPASDSPAADQWRRQLLRAAHEFAGPCLFWTESVEAACLLEDAGAETHDLGWMGVPLLVYMAERGALDSVRFLIEERDHDPNIARADGNYTALHWAKGLEVVRYLADNGGNLHALTSFGDSVAAQQVRNNDAAVIDFLLSLGEERASRANLLHWLTAQPNILRVLCKHNINLSEPVEKTLSDPAPLPPLHRVLNSGIESWSYMKDAKSKAAQAAAVVESVDILLDYGCDPLTRDGVGRVPYHIIQEWLPDPNEPLRQQLDARLIGYNAPRKRHRGR